MLKDHICRYLFSTLFTYCTKTAELNIKSFLGDENLDPRADLITKMLQDITPTGSIVAYNQAFEIERVRELAEFKRDKKDELLSLPTRFVDLIVPFRATGYYHPDFNGSFSIKSVANLTLANEIFQVSSNIEDRLKQVNSIWFDLDKELFDVHLFIDKEIVKYFETA